MHLQWLFVLFALKQSRARPTITPLPCMAAAAIALQSGQKET